MGGLSFMARSLHSCARQDYSDSAFLLPGSGTNCQAGEVATWHR